MGSAGRVIYSELKQLKPGVLNLKPGDVDSQPESVKVLLQPRVCTLRSYGSDRSGVIKSPRFLQDLDHGRKYNVSSFFASLSEYIDSSKRSHDIEILSGRLSMVVIAGTVTMELITGNSLFQKMDLEEMAETAGVCLAAIVFSALFAYFSSARTRVNRIFNIGCNTFIDLFIDNLIESLFFETDLSDWSNDL